MRLLDLQLRVLVGSCGRVQTTTSSNFGDKLMNLFGEGLICFNQIWGLIEKVGVVKLGGPKIDQSKFEMLVAVWRPSPKDDRSQVLEIESYRISECGSIMKRGKGHLQYAVII
jgi:hypothetical protein